MLICTTAGLEAGISPQDSATARQFVYRRHTTEQISLPYRLFIPVDYDPANRYPLIVTLHGAGESGEDNGLHILAQPQAVVWARPASQSIRPCFVLAPQIPVSGRWVHATWSSGFYAVDQTPLSDELQCVHAMIDSLRREFSIDSLRLLITGISRGGIGTWDMIMRQPDLFAAAAPICGGVDTTLAPTLDSLPIWTFHCRDDNVVPVAGTRAMVNALERHGRTAVWTDCQRDDGPCTVPSAAWYDSVMQNNPRLLYSEYNFGMHEGSWRYNAHGYDNIFFIRWFLNQSRSPEAVALRMTHRKGQARQIAVPRVASLDRLHTLHCTAQLPAHEILCYTLNGGFIGRLDQLTARNASLHRRSSQLVVLRPLAQPLGSKR